MWVRKRDVLGHGGLYSRAVTPSDTLTALVVEVTWTAEILGFSNVVWGPIIPDPSGINGQVTEEAPNPGQDLFSGAYCTVVFSGICSNLADPSKLLNANGIFYSLELTVLRSGSGIVAIYSLGNLLPDRTHVLFNIPNNTINFTAIPNQLEVAIDIKPGSDPNCIQATSNGLITVAILGSSLDVTTIDVGTIRIDDDSDPATVGVAPVRSSFNDVDGDGTTDLVVQFNTPQLKAAGLLVDGNMLFITGTLTDGTEIQGSDTIFLAGGPHCR
jgi:hypothetical protein